MSNTFIMWAGFVLPWFTLVFMKKEDIKRLMPVAVFATLTSIIAYDVGLRVGLWTARETYYPFTNLLPFMFGLNPVITMWIIKITYGRFGFYMLANIISDIGFSFFFLGYFLPRRGIMDLNTTPTIVLLTLLVHAVILYGYQMWQESVLLSPSRDNNFSLHPAATKPIQQNNDKQKNEK